LAEFQVSVRKPEEEQWGRGEKILCGYISLDFLQHSNQKIYEASSELKIPLSLSSHTRGSF
jgi:hypothetical protein